MQEIVGALAVGVYGVAIMFAAMQPRRSRFSGFELARRRKQNTAERLEVLRETWYRPLRIWQQTGVGVLLLVSGFLAVGALGWVGGVAVSLAGGVLSVRLARVPLLRSKSQRLYDVVEPHVFRFAQRHGKKLQLLHGNVSRPLAAAPAADSREELIAIIKHSSVATPAERRLLINGMSFFDKKVKAVMTPRHQIRSVAHDELLGPLVLDDLHKTGHSRFPVTRGGDLDELVGVLHLREVAALHQKQSHTAEEAMRASLSYVKATQTLQEALAVCVESGESLCVVIDENRAVVGLVTLGDILATLMGSATDGISEQTFAAS